jgi:hypothetical protein
MSLAYPAITDQLAPCSDPPEPHAAFTRILTTYQKMRDCGELRQREEGILRAVQIRAFCEQRGIQHLTHFTRLENLDSILKHGLVSRAKLDATIEPHAYFVNDDWRGDGCTEANCVSISFPNYQMFYKYRQANLQAQWVVLLLKPDILWELDCAFCRENAASKNVTAIPLTKRKQFSALVEMFDQYPPVKRDTLPSSYPSHPQAEVLVFGTIPTQYIDIICCEDSIATGKSGFYFDARMDYRNWLK